MSEQKQDVAATEQQPVLQIQRIYVKDVSLKRQIFHIFSNKNGNQNLVLI